MSDVLKICSEIRFGYCLWRERVSFGEEESVKIIQFVQYTFASSQMDLKSKSSHEDLKSLHHWQ